MNWVRHASAACSDVADGFYVAQPCDAGAADRLGADLSAAKCSEPDEGRDQPIGPARAQSTPNLALPDNDEEGVRNVLTLDASDCLIQSIRISVDIRHTWIGDLVVILIDPEGTEYLLHDRSGAAQDDLEGVYPTSLNPIADLPRGIPKPTANGPSGWPTHPKQTGVSSMDGVGCDL